MKVAMIEPVGGHGGMNYYDAGLCSGLARAGVSPTLYTSTLDRRDATGFGVRRFFRGVYGRAHPVTRGVRYLFGSVRTAWHARRRGARLAHFHLFHAGPLELFQLCLARLVGLRLVVTAHDVQALAQGASGSARWMTRLAYALAHRIVAHNETSRRELGAELGVAPERVAVIPHGNYLPGRPPIPPRAEARERLGLEPADRVVLFFGQIKAAKGLDVLLRATAQLSSSMSSLRVLVVGKVWKDDFGAYERLIEELGIHNQCDVRLGYVPDERVPDYFAAADIVALPYRRIYQSGALLMAMSYGTPVIASDVDAMKETVVDGETGFLFREGSSDDLARRLKEAVSDPRRLAAIGRRGLRQVEADNDWDRIGALTADAYRRCV